MKVYVPASFSVSHVTAPPSKSDAQRAIVAAVLSTAPTRLRHLGKSDDVQQLLEVAQQLGATISTDGSLLTVVPRSRPVRRRLCCGESGLGMRLTTAAAATFGGHFLIEGSGSLQRRSMSDFATFLPDLGVQFSARNGKPPLKIEGHLRGGTTTIDGSLSSQFLSGFLMALPLAEQASTVKVSQLKSTPYIAMTLAVLADFGIVVERRGETTFYLPGRQHYELKKDTYTVEGDWSGAAFWAVYGAISQAVTIAGIHPQSAQADRAVLDVLRRTGARYRWEQEQLKVFPSSLRPFEFDATDCPDLFPPLAVLAAAIQGTSRIRGTSRLGQKESDRAQTVQRILRQLGGHIDLEGDDMVIRGTGKLQSATIHSHNDHRIAMAGAIAATLTPKGVYIGNAAAVRKSYPSFWETIPTAVVVG